jgi:hypothetical protein
MLRRDGAQDGRQRTGGVAAVEEILQGAAELHVLLAQEDQAGAVGERQDRIHQCRPTARRAVGNRSRARPDVYSVTARRWRPGMEVRPNR